MQTLDGDFVEVREGWEILRGVEMQSLGEEDAAATMTVGDGIHGLCGMVRLDLAHGVFEETELGAGRGGELVQDDAGGPVKPAGAEDFLKLLPQNSRHIQW